jgi:DNA-binding MarR family transcriptional regulator
MAAVKSDDEESRKADDNRRRASVMTDVTSELRGFLAAADAFDEALGEVLDVNGTDLRCLDLLDRLGTMTAGSLATVAGLSTGAVTFLVDRLERGGFVKRRRDLFDRRRVLVEPTAKALDQIRRLHEPLIAAWREATESFSIEELRLVEKFLHLGRTVYEEQVPALRSKAPHRDASVGSAVAQLTAAVKAQATAEAIERIELTARKLQAKAAARRSTARAKLKDDSGSRNSE